MCKIKCDVTAENILAVAMDLEKNSKVDGIAFKYNSTGKLFFR